RACGSWHVSLYLHPPVAHGDAVVRGITEVGKTMCAVLVYYEFGARAGPPVVRARREHGVVPACGRLRPVMPAAQRSQVARARGPARGIGADAVEVAGPGGAPGGWNRALRIPPGHLLPQAVGYLAAAHG